MFVAATGTTAIALISATWHALKNPETERKLVADVLPDRNAMIDWQTLKTLPYLVRLVRILRTRSLS